MDYSAMSAEDILAAIGQAYAAKDMKLMGTLSKLYTKKEGEAEKAKKDALREALEGVTRDILAEFTALAGVLEADGKLDGAEGIYFALDLGAIRDASNPSLRLLKSKRAPSEPGSGSGSSSYIANPAKSADLLAQVGDHVMFAEETLVTIDKVEQTIAAGTTLKEAYDKSTTMGLSSFANVCLLIQGSGCYNCPSCGFAKCA